MAEEHPKAKDQAGGKGEAPAAAAAGAPAQKPAAPAFSRKGIMILGGVVALEAAGFLGFIATRHQGHAEATAKKEEEHHKEGAVSGDEDFAEYLKVGRAVLEVGEIKVPITSTQPRAPRSITATIQVVVSHEVPEKLAPKGGGHGGGGKSNPQKDVLVLNIRSILRGMMDQDGIRLIEPSAKADFERRAKERLNLAQIEGDEEKAQVLKILRGQVLQVIIDKFDTQSY